MKSALSIKANELRCVEQRKGAREDRPIGRTERALLHARLEAEATIPGPGEKIVRGMRRRGRGT